MSSERINLKELDELLDAWPDEEGQSDVHIEEFHYHSEAKSAPEFTKEEVVTKPFPEPEKKPSLSPQAKRISLIIIGVATGLATAVKIFWEVWQGLK